MDVFGKLRGFWERAPGAICIENYNSVIVVLFLWFAFQTLFFAIFVVPVTPDYDRHLFLSNLYYENPTQFPFVDNPEYYRKLIETPATPYLYHLLMGWSLHANIFHLSPLLFLRLVNVVLGLLTLIYSLKFVREVSNDQFVQLCALGILTNTLMYVFLFSGVTYDNLANFCAAASFYYFVRYFKNYSRNDLLGLVLFCSIGALTKITFLPLIFFYSLIFVLQGREIYRHGDRLICRIKGAEMMLLVFCLIFIALGARHYGGNVISYGKILPGAEDVRGAENALDPLHRRDRKLAETAHERTEMAFVKYLARWLHYSMKGMIGINSHLSVVHPKEIVNIILFLWFLALFFLAWKYKALFNAKTDLYVVGICLAYLTVVFFRNYTFYLRHFQFEIALQGRYLFPVYFPLLVMLLKYSFEGWSAGRKILVLALLCSVYTGLGFFYFLDHGTDVWFGVSW